MAIPEKFLQKPVGAQHVVFILYQLLPPLQATAADLRKRGGEVAFKGGISMKIVTWEHRKQTAVTMSIKKQTHLKVVKITSS